MGGGKSGSTGTQQQTSSVSIPPEVLARYNSVNATAEGVAQAPFNSYTGAFVAPINDTQQRAIQQITDASGWIPGTYSNTVNTISAGLAGAQPYYGAAGSNIQAGLAGGQGANQAALGQYGAALGAAQPYNTAASGIYGGAGSQFGTAAGLAGAGTGAVNPTAVDSSAIGQYMSPYNNAVVQSTMALLGQQQQQQQNQLKTQQILGGSFGGDRSGIDRAVLSGQQGLASANVASNLYNQNYSQALGAAQQQQGVGLGAAQANRAALQTGANQFTGLGQATAGLGQQVAGLGQQVYGQGTGQAQFTGQIGQQGYGQALGAAGAQQGLGQAIFGTNLAAGQGYGQAGGQALQSQLAQGQAQLGAGTVAQQTEQAKLQANYNQFLQQQAYPFQTTQFLANIAEGTGALSGSTTSANNYSPQPFFSDRRLKENIKTIAHTKAGIPIVQYNYKGKPGTQIGLIAQDVEKRRPEAVGLAHGYKTVDYERALRAGGGGVGLAGGGPAMMIYHIGGSVDDDDAGRGFGTGYADGGAPAMDPNTMAAMLAAHQAMYPGAAGRMGMDSGPRGMQLHQPAGRSLMKADLIKPQEQQSQTRNAAQGLGDVAGAGKSAAAIYDMGKDAAVGSAAKGTPGTAGYTPATGGLAGTGGQWSPESGWFGKTAAGLGAANSNTPSSVTSQPLPDITPPAAVDASTIADASSGLVDDALSSAWAWRGGRQKRYASGGMPYGDAGDGYIPDDLYEPIDVGDLAKEQKGMGAPLTRFDEGGGKSKSSTGKSAGSLAGGLAGAYFGPMGSMVGSGLGGLLGGALDNKRGGRIGYQEGGYPVDDRPAPFLPTDVAEDLPPYERGNVIPFPDRGLGVARSRSDELPPFEPPVKDGGKFNLGDARAATPNLPPPERNPERPAARELDDKAAVWREPVDGRVQVPPAEQVSPGLNPPAEPATTIDMAPARAAPPVPGLAPPRQISEPPGFRSPGMQTPQDSKVDVYGNILMRESGNSHWGANGQPKRGEAGEVGVGQIMPNTGPIAARDAGLPWNPALFNQAKTGDPAKDKETEDYHRALSSGHFQALKQTFGGDEVKAAAAYNCGERCVADAVAKGGADWMRHIPGTTQQYVAAVTGQGGGGRGTMALNAPATGGLGGASAGPGLNPPKDFLDRAGDWYDRNEKRIVPALAFLGSMLSSPSRTLAGSIGSGLVGGAQALQGQQQLGQGQQRIDITRNAQLMGLWAQLRNMYANQIATGGKADPQLKAQMDRIAGMISSGTGSGGGGGPPTSGEPPAGGPDLPAGGGAPNLAPPAQLPTLNAPTPAGGPISTASVTNPPATPGPTPAVTDQDPPSMRQPNVDFPPDFRAKLDPMQDPVELRRRAMEIAGANPAEATRLREQAAQVQRQMLDTGFAQGKDGNQIPVPNANALKVSQARVEDNLKWQTENQPVFQSRQIMRNNIDQIAKVVQTLEPGEFTRLKADLQGALKGVGFTPHSTATMNAEEYQTFIKDARNVIMGSPTNDAKTDAARQILAEGFADPHLQPKAVRRILAQSLGNLDYADDFYKDVNDKLVRAPHLNRSMRAAEFDKERPVGKYMDEHEKNLAVRGDVPEKITGSDIGRAYIMTPQEMFKLMPKNSDATIDKVQQQFFGGANRPQRFRIKVINGHMMPVPENG